jgi:hypothetical protein
VSKHRKTQSEKTAEPKAQVGGPVEPEYKEVTVAELIRLDTIVRNHCGSCLAKFEELVDDLKTINEFATDVGGIDRVTEIIAAYKKVLQMLMVSKDIKEGVQ